MNNQNHHHSTSSRTPECVSIGPLLALLDDEMLDSRDAARVRAHLSGCAACRAQRHAYSRLDTALRRHFSPVAFAPLRMENIVEDLSREHTSTEPLDVGPLASLSQPPMSRQPRRILSGVASLAAVLVIALLATFIFANHPHPGTGSTSDSHTSSQTSLTGISMVSPDEGWMVGSTSTTTFTSKIGPTQSSTVSSSTPGVSSASSSSAELTEIGTGTGTALLYHYKNGTWAPYTITPRIPGIAHLTSISMDSPTDGWAVGGTLDGPSFDPSTAKALLLHYDGTAWRQVASPVNAALGSVYMLSPTNGWALTEAMGVGQQSSEILHYNGSVWLSQPLPSGLSANASEVLNFTGFSALPNGEAWAAAVLFPNGKPVVSGGSASSKNGTPTSSSIAPGQSAPGQPALPSSVILHYMNGVWTVQGTFANAVVNAVAMAGPDDGWAAGQDIPDFGAPPIQKPQQPSTLLLRYTGGQWTRVALPLTGADGAAGVALTHLAAFSPSDIWIFGTSEKMASGMAVPGSQGDHSRMQLALPQGSLALLHYNGTRWTSVAGPSFAPNAMPSLMDVAFTSPNSGWAVGSLITFPNNPTSSSADPLVPRVTPLVLHYFDGAWGVYKLP